MILEGLAGLVLLVVGLVVLFISVPRKEMIELVPIGITAGFALALALIYVMQNVFGFWIFNQVDILNIGRIPVLLSLTWLPLVMEYSYLLNHSKNLLFAISLIISFPLAAVLTHYLMIANGMLTYNQWNLTYTFLQSFVIHTGIALYLYLSGRLNNLFNKMQQR